MQGVRCLHVIGAEGQVELFITQIVGGRAILEPGQFQLEGFGVIRHKDDGEFRLFVAAHLMKAQRLAVEGQGAVQIADVVVLMDHGEHGRFSPLLFNVYGKVGIGEGIVALRHLRFHTPGGSDR